MNVQKDKQKCLVKLNDRQTDPNRQDLPKGSERSARGRHSTAKGICLPEVSEDEAAPKRNRFGLNTVSMTELYDTVYPPRKPIVNDLLYSGTYLFVGAPKVGKSFFMGQLAYHVAMGLPLWEYEVHQGTVLYLALEDDYARLQRRLSRMFGVEETSNLYFATQAKSVSEGLDQQLEGFIREHPDVRLIIIDTLQKVREIGGDRYDTATPATTRS